MNQETILVKYVNQPDKIPDLGSVKDAAGKYWNVPQNMLWRFVPDTQYKVGYTNTTAKNGRVYSTIKEIIGDSAASPVPHKPNGSNPRQIFVCAVVKEWVPKIPVGETTTLISAIESAMDAYDQTFGNDN